MRKRARSSAFKKTLKVVGKIKDWDQWVSPSSMSGAVLDDPLLTYFEARGKGRNKRKRSEDSRSPGMTISNDSIPTSPSLSFNEVIMQMGQQYEEDLFQGLQERFGDDVLEIEDGTVLEKLQATLDALAEGVPIIYQPVLVNIDNQTFGIPDLLVRSNYLKKLFPKTKIRNKHSWLGRFHYVVIDIKWSTIWFRTGKRTLRKHGRINAYKSQLWVYNQALGQLQGFTPSIAYVWGRAWKHQKKNVITSGKGDELLGEVHFDGIDSFVEEKVLDAVAWVKDVRKNAHKWTLDPPSRLELYPNMKNKFDGKWHKEKVKLAKKLGEITHLWYCGLKARKEAWDIGIKSYFGTRLKAVDMGIKGRRGEILDKIIKVQQPNATNLVEPQYIANNYMGWQDHPSSGVQELFVDFETISSFMLNPKDPSASKDRVFMVGVGHMGRRWQYRCFIAKSLDEKGERELFEEFYKYLTGWIDRDILLYHWGQAEQDWLDKIYARYPDVFPIKMNDYWVDFHKIVSEEPVVVRGATNFSLKNYTQALHDNGLINCIWASGDCCDGMDAMAAARACYATGRGHKDRLMTHIRNYNEVDCRAVYENMIYLRNNHTCPKLQSITAGEEAETSAGEEAETSAGEIDDLANCDTDIDEPIFDEEVASSTDDEDW